MKDILYDLTELLFKAIKDNTTKLNEYFEECFKIKNAAELLREQEDDYCFETLGGAIMNTKMKDYPKLYEVVKDIDVGYETTEAKNYLLHVCKRMEVC